MKDRILVISPRPTHRPNTGSRKCILDYCMLLQNMGFDVYFFHIKDQVKERFWNNKDYMETKEYWGDHYFELYDTYVGQFFKWAKSNLIKAVKLFFCNGYYTVDQFYDSGLSKKINRINKKYRFKTVIINYVWLSKSLQKINIPNKIIFTHDVFSHKTISFGIRAESLKPSAESKALRRCPKILAIQTNEAALFKYLSPLSRIYTVFSPFQFVKQEITDNDNILFLSGPNKYNLNGISYFIKEVFPIIRKEYPNAKLLIGGGICNVMKTYGLACNIRLYGIVESVNDFYRLGDIVINPVSQGSGLKIKTFEAISFGKSTFVHPHSAEGIYNPQNAPLFLCDTPEVYASKIIESLKNRGIRRKKQNDCEAYIEAMNTYIRKEYYRCLTDIV